MGRAFLCEGLMSRTIGVVEVVTSDSELCILSMRGYGPVKRHQTPFADDGTRHSYPMDAESYWRHDAVASGDGWELGVPELALPYLKPLWEPLRQNVSKHGGRWFVSMTIEAPSSAPETVRRGLIPIAEDYTVTVIARRAGEGEGW